MVWDFGIGKAFWDNQTAWREKTEGNCIFKNKYYVRFELTERWARKIDKTKNNVEHSARPKLGRPTMAA